MKIIQFAIFLLLVILFATAIYAQDVNPPPYVNVPSYVKSLPQEIGDFIGDASPFVLIGLGILLFLVQKIAKLVGIILLIIGVIRLALMFMQ